MSEATKQNASPSMEKTRILKKGDPYVWLGAICASTILLLFATLVCVVFINGFGIFWVDDYYSFSFKDGTKVVGSIQDKDDIQHKTQLYTGNREWGLDYRWVDNADILSREQPDQVVVLERTEKGNYIGFLKELHLNGETVVLDHAPLLERLRQELKGMHAQIEEAGDLQKRLTVINGNIETSRRAAFGQENNPTRLQQLEDEQVSLRHQYDNLSSVLDEKRAGMGNQVAVIVNANGDLLEIALMDILDIFEPNQMGFFSKSTYYMGKVVELLMDNPRESNTEGGLFPAILGTIMMVMLMTVFCVPLGVVTAVYLREYAHEGWLVNLVRIAVNNLAGVPSIVYGMFGLGFFVYGIGGTLDDLFFSDRMPLPTFGTGGLLWASLTMALLTVPVVIVSTEEGLGSVPQGVRDGSLALGGTKFQTLTKVVLPMATPGMLTGLILAIARAAGEVAPLMLVGVVKSVQTLPIDSEFPFVKLEHKFMHLGFHIFDVGFQSPNVEAAKPMVYVTTLLLLGLVLAMSFLAMYLRNRMKKRYTLSAF